MNSEKDEDGMLICHESSAFLLHALNVLQNRIVLINLMAIVAVFKIL